MKKFETPISTSAMDVLLLLVGSALMNQKAWVLIAKDMVGELKYPSCSDKDVKGYLMELFSMINRFYEEMKDAKDTAQA